MSPARKTFFDRLAVLTRTLDSEYLRDVGVTTSIHNEKARILRNGISIIAFTILEDFIKQRTGEVLKSVSSASITFNSLSPKFQEATTIDAIKSIQAKVNNMKNAQENWLDFIQKEAGKIASTANFPFDVSEFSLGWEKSNLSKDDIPRFMKIFNIEKGWATIQLVTAKANSTLPSPESVFTSAAQRRHKSAHDPTANSLYIDLENFSKDIKSLLFAYDILISKGIHHIITKNPEQVSADKINIRFLIRYNGKWGEFSGNTARPIRLDNNYNRLLAKVRERATRRNEAVVIKRNSGEIYKWFS
jgi:hypothetical protein